MSNLSEKLNNTDRYVVDTLETIREVRLVANGIIFRNPHEHVESLLKIIENQALLISDLTHFIRDSKDKLEKMGIKMEGSILE